MTRPLVSLVVVLRERFSFAAESLARLLDVTRLLVRGVAR